LIIKKIKSLLVHNESGSLESKVKKGVVWTGLLSIWTRGLGLISAVIITRVLNPDDFGLMAIAHAIIAITTGLTATGFSSAIIQKQEGSEKLLNSAWTMELMRGFILFLIIFILAPTIAGFYKNESLVLMLRVLSLSFLIHGTTNIGVLFFRKDLDIRKEFAYNAIPDFLYLLTMVVLAIWLRSVWALVIAAVFSSFFRTVVSFIIHPYRPKIEINLQRFQELFSFGKWILVSTIIGVTRNQGVSLFLGRSFGIASLGGYNRGETFSKTIFDELSNTLWKVGYPAFSKISSDKRKLKRVFLVGLKAITTIGFPMAAGMFILSPKLVQYVLTDKWISIVPIIQLFAVNSIIVFIQTPVGISFQALGKPSVGSKLGLLNLLLFVIIIYPASIISGINGVIMASIIINLLVSPIGWVKIAKMLSITFWEFILAVIPQLVFSGLMMLVIYMLEVNIYTIKNIFDILLYVFIGSAVYIVIVLISDKLSLTNFRALLKNITT
jgi:lipopolysaccharide exporter